MKKFLIIFILLSASPNIGFGQFKRSKIKLPTLLNENSGLVVLNLDSCWWINDSGNLPLLIRSDIKGQIRSIVNVPFQNRDWEELAVDKNGKLYIFDNGLQSNQDSLYRIYRYDFTNNYWDSCVFYIPKIFFINSRFKRFDIEAFIVKGCRIWLFTKNAESETLEPFKLIKFDAVFNSAYPIEASVSEGLMIDNFKITSAVLSAQGTLALCAYKFRHRLGFFPESHATILLFENWDGDTFLHKIKWKNIPNFFFAAQYEAMSLFIDDYLLISAERTFCFKPFFRILKI